MIDEIFFYTLQFTVIVKIDYYRDNACNLSRESIVSNKILREGCVLRQQQFA